MIEDCVIIGGGVAGLSVANQLVDAGKSPLIIDGGDYPCHRICGEYFSHESFRILQKWEIPLTGVINRARFIKENKKVEFSLPISAGSCSHFEFDLKLFNRALKKGARALCKTTVECLRTPENSFENYELRLSDSQIIHTRHLIIGTGKLPKIAGIQAKIPIMKYIGFKAHFEGVEIDDSIEMHTFSGGYLGVAKINAKTTNIAGLFHKDIGKNFNSPEILLENLLKDKSMSILKEKMRSATMVFPKWLECQVPEFGIRKNPQWERVFWIGDAAGGIPPVSGEGLAIALTSGCMAADYLLKSNSHQFKIDWLRRYGRRYFWANQLHRGLMRPWLHEIGIKLFHLFPSLPIYLWQLTREKKSYSQSSVIRHLA